MRATYEIELASGDVFHVDSDARDVRAWEAEYGLSFFDSPWSYTQANQIAYLAAMRQNVFEGRYPSYKDFDAVCVRLDAKVGPQPFGNPTQPAAMDVSSVPSLSGSDASQAA